MFETKLKQWLNICWTLISHLLTSNDTIFFATGEKFKIYIEQQKKISHLSEVCIFQKKNSHIQQPSSSSKSSSERSEKKNFSHLFIERAKISTPNESWDFLSEWEDSMFVVFFIQTQVKFTLFHLNILETFLLHFILVGRYVWIIY